MIFIDRSIPKSVASALKQVRNDVLWLEDRFPHDARDRDWLPVAGEGGWLVIMRDKKVRTRQGERQAIVEHGVGCFIVNQSNDPTRWEYLKLIVANLDEMERRFAETPRPFIYTITRDGTLNQVLRQ